MLHKRAKRAQPRLGSANGKTAALARLARPSGIRIGPRGKLSFPSVETARQAYRLAGGALYWLEVKGLRKSLSGALYGGSWMRDYGEDRIAEWGRRFGKMGAYGNDDE